MKKKAIAWSGSVIVVLAILVFSIGGASSFEAIDAFEGEMKIYKSLSCGCCGIYSNYFNNKGNSDVEVINLNSLDSLKEEHGVPRALESCHTTIIGDYFVEGHIPLEAIEKLLQEQPDIAGIAMPGMPEGSPGMPGVKRGDFIIYAVNHDGSYEEFMRI